MVVNGWNLFYFRLFRARLDALEQDVTAILQKDPEGFERHPTVKLLKAIVDNVRVNVPRDPDHKDFGSMPFPVEFDFNKGLGSVPIRATVSWRISR